MKIGFIGCGNMGGALASAAAKSGNEILLADNMAEKCEQLAQKIGAAVSDNESICRECDYIFLGVKPQVLFSLLGDIAPVVSARKKKAIFVSMAAGCTAAQVSSALGSAPVIRIMPNTPVGIGKGVIAYCGNEHTSEDDINKFLNFMDAAGTLEFVSEELIDAATVVSGCGPAFVYMFIKALADGGEKCGLSAEKALKLAAATVSGAAENLMQSEMSVDELIKAVCSPGGSTIEGVRHFEQNGLNELVLKATEKSFNRTKELGKK